MAEEEDNSLRERSSWADLPKDLLCDIYSRVYAADRAFFRCVCKPWKLACSSLLTNTKRIQLPLNYDSVHHSGAPYLFFQNKLCHPMVHDVEHRIDLPDKPGATIHVVKDGWLLMSHYPREFFFYNPLTRDLVDLPDFYNENWRSMSFSKPPTSKDWKVVVAQWTEDNCVEVCSTRDGQGAWSGSCFKMKSHFKLSSCNAVMIYETCYFLCEDGKLIRSAPIRTIIEGKFYSNLSICKEVRDYGGQQYLLESDGKLLGVFVSCDGHFVRVYQWDPSSKKWETVERLDDKMLFVSPASSMCIPATLKGTGNKIYFPRFMDNHCLFYSLSTKRYHTFDGGSYQDFNIKGSKCYKNSTWIQPQFSI